MQLTVEQLGENWLIKATAKNGDTASVLVPMKKPEKSHGHIFNEHPNRNESRGIQPQV